MKLAVAPWFTIILSSCGITKEDSVKDFIPGVYARHFEGEFSKGNDTLRIELFSGSTYVITRGSSYRRIGDGKVHSPERKLQKLTAVYDEKEAVLVENKKGLIISFNPEKKILLFGNSVFEKIN